jgi:hypothetical protein
MFSSAVPRSHWLGSYLNVKSRCTLDYPHQRVLLKRSGWSRGIRSSCRKAVAMERVSGAATPGGTGPAYIPHQAAEYQGLLEELRRWRGPGGQRLRLRIAEVAFFYQGSMNAWYFSSAEDGSLIRKSRPKLNTLDFAAALLKRHAATPPHEPVALAVLAAGDGGDGGSRTVAPLTADALRWLLLNERARRQRLVAVLRYVPPRGERESVLRVDWRTQLQGIELRSSRAALCDARVPLVHRLATHHADLLGYSRQEQHTPPAALRQALALCARLSGLLLPLLRTGNNVAAHYSLKAGERRFCADFKLAHGGNNDTELVLLWALLPPPGAAAFPAFLFPASMPPELIPPTPFAPPPTSTTAFPADYAAAATIAAAFASAVSSSITSASAAPPGPFRRQSCVRPASASAAVSPTALSAFPAAPATVRPASASAASPRKQFLCSRLFACPCCANSRLTVALATATAPSLGLLGAPGADSPASWLRRALKTSRGAAQGPLPAHGCSSAAVRPTAEAAGYIPRRFAHRRQARAPRTLADRQPRGGRRPARHPLAAIHPPTHSGRRVSIGGRPAAPLATTWICGY